MHSSTSSVRYDRVSLRLIRPGQESRRRRESPAQTISVIKGERSSRGCNHVGWHLSLPQVSLLWRREIKPERRASKRSS